MERIQLGRERHVAVDRSGDRRVALAAIVIALAFLGAAFGSIALPAVARRGMWLPLHLAMAGGATSAIAGVMPFFVAAFAAPQPADVRLRATSLASVAIGAIAVAVGVVVAPVTAVAASGGILFVVGII